MPESRSTAEARERERVQFELLKLHAELPTAHTLVRSTHHEAYRPFEWAKLRGVVYIRPKAAEFQRICFELEYLDGTIDHIPVSATNEYGLQFQETLP